MKEKAFKQLTPAQQRVAIAKDVIKQIKAEVYVARKGIYIGFKDLSKHFGKTGISQEKARKLEPCFVCGIGAVAMSAVKLFNEISLYDETQTGRYYTAFNAVTKWFDSEQAELIEIYFEVWTHKMYADLSQRYNLAAFAEKYPTATKRLVAIMRNIIKNKGVFIPDDYTKKVAVKKVEVK